MNMLQSARELWLALIAILLITTLYLLSAIVLGGVPAASEFFGHSLGVLGFLLMLMTEFLYSRRKRSRRARWGKMSAWLQFHIFTGIVGPYLVFLHTSFKFNGLAGVVMLFTLVVVVSGFVGRYIYTALPRTADGQVLEFGELDGLITSAEDEIDRWVAENPDTGLWLREELRTLASFQGSTAAAIFLRGPLELVARLRWRRLRQQINSPPESLDRLEYSMQRRRTLTRQIATLSSARRLLGLWHTVHVPLGVVLFTTATIHILAAIYYATLLQ